MVRQHQSRFRGRSISRSVLHAAAAALLFVPLAAGQDSRAASNASQKGTRRALVIANGNYTHLPVLSEPARNGGALASALSGLGFDVKVAYDLGQAQMLGTTAEFKATIRPGDNVLFFYSGYGMQVDGRNWLVPVTYEPNPDIQVFNKAFSLSRLLDDFDDQKAGDRFVLIDASRDAQIVDRTGNGLANMEPLPRTVLSFSNAPGQTTTDTPTGVGHYTQALIEAMKVPGLPVTELFAKVQRDVVAATKNTQFPFSISLAISEFYFTAPKPVEKVPEVTTKRRQWKTGDEWENPKDELKYVYIAPGTFVMGCSDDKKQDCKDDEKPAHKVTITRPLLFSRSETIVRAWRRFADATRNGTMPKETGYNPQWRNTFHPISNITWNDATEYCKWAGGRLPTEAEWEYAARGGKTGQVYPWGDEISRDHVNYLNSKKRTLDVYNEVAPIETFPANAWGLYDVVGNVQEWVADFYAPSYPSGPAVDPTGPINSSERVARGGSFGANEKEVRLAARAHYNATASGNTLGFRCVIDHIPE